MHAGYPSLNLSQSVMIIAYELSILYAGKGPGKQSREKKRIGNEKGFLELKQRTQFLLRTTGIPEGTPLHHRIMERIAILKSGDIALLHSVSSRLMDFLSENTDETNELEP